MDSHYILLHYRFELSIKYRKDCQKSGYNDISIPNLFPYGVSMAFIDSYNIIRGDLDKIFRSRLTIQTLLSLDQGGKSLTELREITGSSSQALIPIIRKLELNNLIVRVSEGYCLTPVGQIMNIKINDVFSFLSVISTYKSYFKDHYLEAIPLEFLQEIEKLNDSYLLSDTQVEIFAVYSNFLKIVAEAKWIYGISSIMSLGHAEAIAKRVKEGIVVDLVVDNAVMDQLRSDPYNGLINEIAKYSNFKIFLYKNKLNLGIILSNSTLSLGLYKADKITYDTTMDILSKNPTAIAWGERVFNYFKEKSELMVL